MNIYWGDIHNHCDISYGFGSIENALAAAREQLDFCSVTGHAMWPDMVKNRSGQEFVIKYHKEGFRKLLNNWENILEIIKNANDPGKFITFQGYEIHSSEHGDYHIISTDDTLPIIESASHQELVASLLPRSVMAIPHHVGYTPGYRGCNWDTFNEKISPVVEVFSKHGCGIRDYGPYPYLHTMGPRDSRTTVHAGLNKGHRFGFAASTDHHAGYPGSYGDGRLAVLASAKTRKNIWDGIMARRTYAVTGDKIKCMFKVNGEYMGSDIQDDGKREISLDITACDRIEKIVIYKNANPWKIINGCFDAGRNKPNSYKIRVEMGWGNRNEGFLWDGMLSIKDGQIKSVESCFRGKNILAPSLAMEVDPDINRIENKIISIAHSNVNWRCTTFKNPTTLHSQTASLIFEVEGDEDTKINVDVNGIMKNTTIGELNSGSISYHLKPYSSEALLLHKPVPESYYKCSLDFIDKESENICDIYYVEVQQVNGQYAWISPIYANRI